MDGGAEEVAGRVAPDGRWYARPRNALPLRSPFGAAGCGPRRRLDIDPRPILVPDSRDSNHHQALDTRAMRLLSNMKSTSIGACLLLGVVRRGGGASTRTSRTVTTVPYAYRTSLVPDVYVYRVRIYVSYPTFECVCVHPYVHACRKTGRIHNVATTHGHQRTEP